MSASRRRDAGRYLFATAVLSFRRAAERSFRICVTKARLCFSQRGRMGGFAAAEAVRFNKAPACPDRYSVRVGLRRAHFTPIHEISEDSRPYSILGAAVHHDLAGRASALAAAAIVARRVASITFGNGDIFRLAPPTGMMWLELRKMSIMSTARPISAARPRTVCRAGSLPRDPDDGDHVVAALRQILKAK